MFNMVLATLKLGEVERAGGRAEAWEAWVNDQLLFHPAGRQAEVKLIQPQAFRPLDDWLDG